MSGKAGAMWEDGLPRNLALWLGAYTRYWITTTQLIDVFGVHPNTMRRALYRLRDKGLVESRKVRIGNEREWRAVQ